MRAAYAVLATERDCKGGYGAKILHASRIFGHFTPEKQDDRVLGKLGTSAGYSDYYITKPVRFVSVEVEKIGNVKAYASDLEKIKELQETWKLPNQRDVVKRLLMEAQYVQALERGLVEVREKITHLQETVTSYEEQLNQLQAENQQLKERETMSQQPQVTEVTDTTEVVEASSDRRIEKLEAQMAQMMVMMQQIVSSGSTVKPIIEESHLPTSAPATPRKQVSSKQEIDWESVPNEQLKGMKVNGAVEEKIYRAFSAIASYNDNAPSNDDRWYIGSTTLSQVSGCNRQAIGDWVKVHQLTVDDHNNKYGLGQYHNKRHKGIEVTDKVNLWDATAVSGQKFVPAVVKSEKITKLPVTTTTLEIIDYLGSHPNENVQIKCDGKTLTYERINDDTGKMKAFRVLKTGEEVLV